MCIISPNRFETTSRGGFGGTSLIRIHGAVRTRFSRLDPDLWCSAARPLGSHVLVLFVCVFYGSFLCSISLLTSSVWFFLISKIVYYKCDCS